MTTSIERYVLSEHIRMPTSEEVNSFRAAGWAYLPQLVSPELATELLRRIKDVVGFPYDEVPENADASQKVSMTVSSFALNPMPRLHDEFLRQYAESRELGEVAARLTGIRPMRLVTDTVIYKLPEWTGAGDATTWHQDTPNMPLEPKTGCIQTWLALCEISPEMGAMQHLSGSHLEGPVKESGDSMDSNTWSFEEFLAEFPQMQSHPLSEPHDFQPGDALVHDGLCAHGAPPNRTNKVRWAYTSYRIPATTRYVGRPNSPWLDSLGLTVDQPPEHPLLPIVVE
jgi:ectoine hydroxylase-related dioxygenase (phytanoyl-CoA dioxygenase family)